MTPLWNELRFRQTEAATAKGDAPLLDEKPFPHEILAYVAENPITESDFRWVLQRRASPSQRPSAYSRPGVRRAMLDSFFDLRVLEAKAKKERLDTTPEYQSRNDAAKAQLLLEFLQQRDKVWPYSSTLVLAR